MSHPDGSGGPPSQDVGGPPLLFAPSDGEGKEDGTPYTPFAVAGYSSPQQQAPSEAAQHALAPMGWQMNALTLSSQRLQVLTYVLAGISSASTLLQDYTRGALNLSHRLVTTWQSVIAAAGARRRYEAEMQMFTQRYTGGSWCGRRRGKRSRPLRFPPSSRSQPTVVREHRDGAERAGLTTSPSVDRGDKRGGVAPGTSSPNVPGSAAVPTEDRDGGSSDQGSATLQGRHAFRRLRWYATEVYEKEVAVGRQVERLRCTVVSALFQQFLSVLVERCEADFTLHRWLKCSRRERRRQFWTELRQAVRAARAKSVGGGGRNKPTTRTKGDMHGGVPPKPGDAVGRPPSARTHAMTSGDVVPSTRVNKLDRHKEEDEGTSLPALPGMGPAGALSTCGLMTAGRSAAGIPLFSGPQPRREPWVARMVGSKSFSESEEGTQRGEGASGRQGIPEDTVQRCLAEGHDRFGSFGNSGRLLEGLSSHVDSVWTPPTSTPPPQNTALSPEIVLRNKFSACTPPLAVNASRRDPTTTMRAPVLTSEALRSLRCQSEAHGHRFQEVLECNSTSTGISSVSDEGRRHVRPAQNLMDRPQLLRRLSRGMCEEACEMSSGGAPVTSTGKRRLPQATAKAKADHEGLPRHDDDQGESSDRNTAAHTMGAVLPIPLQFFVRTAATSSPTRSAFSLMSRCIIYARNLRSVDDENPFPERRRYRVFQASRLAGQDDLGKAGVTPESEPRREADNEEKPTTTSGYFTLVIAPRAVGSCAHAEPCFGNRKFILVPSGDPKAVLHALLTAEGGGSTSRHDSGDDGATTTADTRLPWTAAARSAGRLDHQQLVVLPSTRHELPRLRVGCGQGSRTTSSIRASNHTRPSYHPRETNSTRTRSVCLPLLVGRTHRAEGDEEGLRSSSLPLQGAPLSRNRGSTIARPGDVPLFGLLEDDGDDPENQRFYIMQASTCSVLAESYAGDEAVRSVGLLTASEHVAGACSTRTTATRLVDVDGSEWAPPPASAVRRSRLSLPSPPFSSFAQTVLMPPAAGQTLDGSSTLMATSNAARPFAAGAVVTAQRDRGEEEEPSAGDIMLAQELVARLQFWCLRGQPRDVFIDSSHGLGSQHRTRTTRSPDLPTKKAPLPAAPPTFPEPLTYYPAARHSRLTLPLHLLSCDVGQITFESAMHGPPSLLSTTTAADANYKGQSLLYDALLASTEAVVCAVREARLHHGTHHHRRQCARFADMGTTAAADRETLSDVDDVISYDRYEHLGVQGVVTWLQGRVPEEERETETSATHSPHPPPLQRHRLSAGEATRRRHERLKSEFRLARSTRLDVLLVDSMNQKPIAALTLVSRPVLDDGPDRSHPTEGWSGAGGAAQQDAVQSTSYLVSSFTHSVHQLWQHLASEKAILVDMDRTLVDNAVTLPPAAVAAMRPQRPADTRAGRFWGSPLTPPTTLTAFLHRWETQEKVLRTLHYEERVPITYHIQRSSTTQGDSISARPESGAAPPAAAEMLFVRPRLRQLLHAVALQWNIPLVLVTKSALNRTQAVLTQALDPAHFLFISRHRRLITLEQLKEMRRTDDCLPRATGATTGAVMNRLEHESEKHAADILAYYDANGGFSSSATEFSGRARAVAILDDAPQVWSEVDWPATVPLGPYTLTRLDPAGYLSRNGCIASHLVSNLFNRRCVVWPTSHATVTSSSTTPAAKASLTLSTMSAATSESLGLEEEEDGRGPQHGPPAPPALDSRGLGPLSPPSAAPMYPPYFSRGDGCRRRCRSRRSPTPVLFRLTEHAASRHPAAATDGLQPSEGSVGADHGEVIRGGEVVEDDYFADSMWADGRGVAGPGAAPTAALVVENNFPGASAAVVTAVAPPPLQAFRHWPESSEVEDVIPLPVPEVSGMAVITDANSTRGIVTSDVEDVIPLPGNGE